MVRTKKKLSICIGCLTSEGTLIDLNSSGLLVPYRTLTGFQGVDEHGLQESMCWECAASVRRFDSFRVKCETAHTLLRDLHIVHEKVTKHSIKSIKREQFGLVSSLSRTGVLYIDVTAEEYVKRDANKTKNAKEDTDVVNAKDDTFFDEELQKDDDIFDMDGFDGAIDNAVEDFPEDVEEVETVGTKIGADPMPALEPKERKRLRWKESANNSDTKALEVISDGLVLAKDVSEYATIVTLTPEEQRAEILKRKDSSNYRRASYRCDLCFKGFAHEESYSNHMVKHDLSAGEFECGVCRSRFNTKKKMTTHIAQVHLLQYKCKFCQYHSQVRDQAWKHYKWHMGVKYKCKICGMEFEKTTTYLSHCRYKHPCDEVCHVCGDSFATPNGLKQHIGLRHKDSPLSHHCRECDTHFPTRVELKKHMHINKRHGSDADAKECSECDVKFVNAEELEQHRRESHQLDERTGNMATSDVHMECDASLSRSYCVLCKVAFLSREAWTKHVLTSFKHKHERHEIENGCKHCGKVFPDGESLKEHLHSVGPYPVTADVTFNCEQCDMTMTSHREYHAHFRRHHSDKTRTYYPAMKAPVMCEICGKICQTSIALKVHMNRHTGERPYKCDICGKSFANTTTHKMHVRTHTKEKPYRCDTCGMPFANRNNMVRHKAVHSNETPFCCEVCGKQFKYKYTVKMHMDYVHMKKPWPKRDKTKKRSNQPVAYEYLIEQQ